MAYWISDEFPEADMNKVIKMCLIHDLGECFTGDIPTFDKTKAQIITGDFSQLVYAMRQDITFKLFTEGVVQNTDGTIAYNLMQNDMVALRAVMRLGWEIPNPINSQQKDKAKRCPFAVLAPAV